MEKKYTPDKISTAINRIEDGVKNVFKLDEYMNFLHFAAQFHNHSFNNILLIYSQKPNASYIAGFKAWKEKGYHVLKGEKGIEIFAPMLIKEKHEHIKKDEFGNAIVNENGEPVIETTEVKSLHFRIVHVFDISQTNAEPPQLTHELQGEDVRADCLIEAVKEVSPFRVCFADENTDEYFIRKNVKGYCSYEAQQIVIRNNMSGIQTAKTLLHEYAYSVYNNSDTRMERGVEAESTAFILASHFGLDTSEYSMPYIASLNDKETVLLKDVLNNIQQNAYSLIETVEPVYERNIKEYMKHNSELDSIMDRISELQEISI